MLRNKIILFIPLLLLTACIKQFTPDFGSDAVSKVVVSGKVTNKSGYQYVTLSKSIALDESKYQPLPGSNVSIWDNDGNEFQMEEFEPGKYRVWMNSVDLKIGTSYSIKILTPDGNELLSDPEIMTDVAQLQIPDFKNDSIYNGAFNYYTPGIRFFVDVESDETKSKYYLFELDATYEHHAQYAREWYYDDTGVHQISPVDSSLFFCWTTQRVPEVITLSTENLSQNKFTNLPLHFVPFNKDYLTYGYSLLVRQVGLSRKAYLYWENMRLNNNQNAELYSKQPVDTQGNIHNITNPEKEVLGFFSASAISELRLFIEPMPTNPVTDCYPEELGRLGFRQIGKENYPGYLMSNPFGGYFRIWLHEPCVNCMAYHGSTIKPDFWPY